MVRQFFTVVLILLTLAPAPADDMFPAATTARVAMQSKADQLVLASFLNLIVTSDRSAPSTVVLIGTY